MSEPTFEYRVRWRRHGRMVTMKTSLRADAATERRQESQRTYSAIYQTARAATEKAERLVRMDEDKYNYADERNDGSFDFPDLTAPPTIERRTVGTWAPYYDEEAA